LGLAIAGVLLLLLLGQAYRMGYLLPEGTSTAAIVFWTLNNLIIYSPVFLVLAIRRQPLSTVFLSGRGLIRKSAVGAVMALLAVVLYLAFRGEIGRFPRLLAAATNRKSVPHLRPVFLEGVAVAFLFVRIRWALGF